MNRTSGARQRNASRLTFITLFALAFAPTPGASTPMGLQVNTFVSNLAFLPSLTLFVDQFGNNTPTVTQSSLTLSDLNWRLNLTGTTASNDPFNLNLEGMFYRTSGEFDFKGAGQVSGTPITSLGNGLFLPDKDRITFGVFTASVGTATVTADVTMESARLSNQTSSGNIITGELGGPTSQYQFETTETGTPDPDNPGRIPINMMLDPPGPAPKVLFVTNYQNVPEPSLFALLVIGLTGMVIAGKLKRTVNTNAATLTPHVQRNPATTLLPPP